MSEDREPTIHDVLDAVNGFATSVEGRFNVIDQRFEQIDQRFEQIDQRFEQIDQRFGRIESTMVTKDYLDEKIADLRGDLVVLIRKEDKKFSALIDVLKYRQVISNDEATKILSMEPFPQLAL